MIPALALHTFRECHRRPFPFVAGASVAALVLGSHVFQAFSFGAGDIEAANLALSGVFLAGLLHAAFLGTALVRLDLERGTLGLLLTKPVGLATYLAGRMAGLAAAVIALCAAVAAAVSLIFLIPVRGETPAVLGPELLQGWGRALLPVLILEAAALAASAVTTRVFGPLLIFALFIAGSLATSGPAAWLLPDLGVFALEAGGSPPVGILMLYTGVQIVFFLAIAYLALSSRTTFRSQS